jgi:hypothetical protein
MIFCLHIFFIITERLNYIVTYRPIAEQRLGKHIPAGANARNNRRLLLGNDSVNTLEQYLTIEDGVFRGVSPVVI